MFPNGLVEREVCVELPPEDPNRDSGANVGYLVRAMYGLCEAPAIWQAVIQGVMADLGFEANVTTPCMFYDSIKHVVVVAHVDDLASGDKRELLELRKEL